MSTGLGWNFGLKYYMVDLARDRSEWKRTVENQKARFFWAERSSFGGTANLSYFGNINYVHHANFIEKSDQLFMHDQHLGHPPGHVTTVRDIYEISVIDFRGPTKLESYNFTGKLKRAG